jgi:nucleotide-binding universal stress UspA family protein
MSPRTSAPVLVGIDGSHASRLALAHGLWEAARAGVGLVAVHAWQSRLWAESGSGTTLLPQVALVDERKRAEQLVLDEVTTAMADLADPNAVRVKAEAHEGDAGRVLVGTAAEARLLLLGRSGHRGLAGAMLGSTVRYVLHHALVPVMVLPDPGPLPGAAARVVVGYDGEPSAEALRWAVARARREAIELVVLHAWSTPHPPVPSLSALTSLGVGLQQWLDDATSQPLSQAGDLKARVEAVDGSPSGVLLREATREDLIAVGARGRGGFHRLQLGSVALQLAEHAPCPVVVVR